MLGLIFTSLVDVAYCDQFVGLRSHRCARSFLCKSSGRGPAFPAATFASTFFSLRIPGIIVLTLGLFKINRNAISAIVLPAGTNGRSASACATLDFRFSGTKGVAPVLRRPCGIKR